MPATARPVGRSGDIPLPLPGVPPYLDPMHFDRPAIELAPALIGATLTVRGCAGIITETEAYSPDDPAAHSYPGPTKRNAAIFGPAGHAYVYRSYGLHWCLSIVGQPGHAVLIRALQPVTGIDRMADRRGTDKRLALGPGNVAQALGITLNDYGRPFGPPEFRITAGAPVDLVTGPRIGITKAADWPRRFGLKGSRHLSRPFPSSSV